MDLQRYELLIDDKKTGMFYSASSKEEALMYWLSQFKKPYVRRNNGEDRFVVFSERPEEKGWCIYSVQPVE